MMRVSAGWFRQSAHVKYGVQLVDQRPRTHENCALEWSASLTARMGIFAGASGKILPMSWEPLGDAVRHRRKELGLTQADVTARGGPSVETVRAIENNRAGRLGRQSRRALERAIEWDAGTIDAVLEGGAPRVARELATARQRTTCARDRTRGDLGCSGTFRDG